MIASGVRINDLNKSIRVEISKEMYDLKSVLAIEI